MPSLPMATFRGEAPQLTPEQITDLTSEIGERAKQRDAVILAHNYHLPEIQDLADHVGDSLGLSIQAAKTSR